VTSGPRNSVFLAVLLIIVACSASHPSVGAQSVISPQIVARPKSFPSPTLWPSYKALDYRTAPLPLTASEATHVRHILSRVKPCQRQIVYYAYPSNAEETQPLVIFFKDHRGSWRHVLGERNEAYKQIEGEVFAEAPGRYDYSLQADIRAEPCPGARSAAWVQR
jgi:hypothetical protein